MSFNSTTESMSFKMQFKMINRLVILLALAPLACSSQDVSLLVGQWSLYKAANGCSPSDHTVEPYREWLVEEGMVQYTFFQDNTYQSVSFGSGSRQTNFGSWESNAENLHILIKKTEYANGEVYEVTPETIEGRRSRNKNKLVYLDDNLLIICNVIFGTEIIYHLQYFKRINK